MDDEPLISKLMTRAITLVFVCVGCFMNIRSADASFEFIEASTLTDPSPDEIHIIETIDISQKESLFDIDERSPVRLNIHERNILDRVAPWGVIVFELMEESDYYSNLNLSLVLAIIAQESSGMMGVVSSDRYLSCGLMQVTPREWLPDQSALCNNPRVNIETGMWILQNAIDIASERGEPIEYGIAYYNCSLAGVQNDACGECGGLNYADRIMNYWMPLIEGQISWCQIQYGVEYMRSPYSLDGCKW